MINGLVGYGMSPYASSLYGINAGINTGTHSGTGSEGSSGVNPGAELIKPSAAGSTGTERDPRKINDIGRTRGVEECQTCRNRKYQDGSNENVSFKAAAHISPEAAGSAVRAHEGEHVSNAYTKAAQDGGKVIRASVSIHTSVCPECGRTYVSGGTTNTAIRYSERENFNIDLKKDSKAQPR